MYERDKNKCGIYYQLPTDYPDGLNKTELNNMLTDNLTIGFNSIYYDLPLLTLAVQGASVNEIYKASSALVEGSVKPWDVANVPKEWKHIDLKEVAPGVMVGLKLYGGRMHSVSIQDLPYPPDTVTTFEHQKKIREYCFNDTLLTRDLYEALKPQIELRCTMSKRYDIDLMSKSDAQIAEAVLIKEIESLNRGRKITAPKVKSNASKYIAPCWLNFETNELKQLLEEIKACSFVTNSSGILQMPEGLDKRVITIGDSTYRMGIGGLHSSETSINWHADETHQLIDIDATSYYPSIILEQGLFPPQCGPNFLTVYRDIVNRRLAAKKSGDKITADSLKIAINGSFGKLGSPYSKLYAPDLFKQVTITGQLALLMLIEHMEQEGIRVISANTDGIVTRPLVCDIGKLQGIVSVWEALTGYSTEQCEYRSLYSRDVNSYAAIKTDGSVKTKGIFANDGLQKNPSMSIVYSSVIEHLRTGEAIESLIRKGSVKDYLTIRTVKGGGEWKGTYLGKTVRWYWSKIGKSITYATNGHKVSTSDGAVPLMHLPSVFPDDIDYDRYTKAAYDVLRSVGVDYDKVWEAV
jgi:hypothetical protein